MTDTTPTTIADRLAGELETSRRTSAEAAASLRAEAERTAEAIRADARFTPTGRLDALGRLEADARERVAQIAEQHRQTVSRVRDRALASARGQLDADVGLRRAAMAEAAALSGDEVTPAIVRAIESDDAGLVAAIATVAGPGAEALVAERRGALGELALAREAGRELAPQPSDLQQRLFGTFAAVEILSPDERAGLARLERAAEVEA